MRWSSFKWKMQRIGSTVGLDTHMLQSPGSTVTHVVQSLSSSDSLQPHGLQHTRLWVCSNSCPLSWWCHPTISPSVVPISSRLQSFPPLGSFPLSQLFASCGQIVGSFSISPSSEYSGLIFFRIDWFYLLAIQGTAVALAVKKLPANAGDLRRQGFDPWVRKIPWRRTWQPTPVLLPGKFHEQRSLVGYSLWGCKGSDTTEAI